MRRCLGTGEILMLATDGLSPLSAEMIVSEISDELEAVANAFFYRAVAEGSDDKFSLILVRLDEDLSLGK